MEPHRIKVTEPLPAPTREERETVLQESGYNLFRVPSRLVAIDLLTDSGTGSMSADQWSTLMRGDESYAGSPSWERFLHAVSSLTGYRHVIPVHQGRAAERILFTTLLDVGQVVLSNSHFDTTRANIALAGAVPVDLPSPQLADLDSADPFKGNFDLVALKERLHDHGSSVALVLATVTNNAGGGQPVSLDNLAAARRICDQFGVPLFLDACRFAENAYLITEYESTHHGRNVREVARETFRLADGATMSLKKDGLGNIGGFLALNDDNLAGACRDLAIATEGFTTYGGLAGRDLDALAIGLGEVTDHSYLASRHADARYLATGLEAAGARTVRPTGCHAVYIDAGTMLPHIPAGRFPAHALAVELYREGGIRSCDMGSLTLGGAANGEAAQPPSHELLRLALPRRVYTRSHLDHVADTLATIYSRRDAIPGYQILEGEGPLRHFNATLAPGR